MRRWSEAKLSVRFESSPLFEEVKRKCSRPPLNLSKQGSLRNHEGEARHTFNAFIRGGDQEIDTSRFNVDWDPTEAAHRIDDESPLCTSYYRAHFFDGIEQTCCCFAMDDRNVSDRGIALEN